MFFEERPSCRRVVVVVVKAAGLPWVRSRAALHLVDELLEQVIGVVRSGGGFGVVLDAEDRLGFVPQAFDGAVVEIHVRDLDVGRQRVG